MDLSGYSNDVSFSQAFPPSTGTDILQLKVFADAHIPVFFSEYGCNLGGPRIFQETSVIFSPTMTCVFSGGVAFEFFEDGSKHGLVKSLGNGETSEALEKLPDYHSLKNQLQRQAQKDVIARPGLAWEWAVTSKLEARKPDFPPVSASWLASPGSTTRSLTDWERARVRLEAECWIQVEKPDSADFFPETGLAGIQIHQKGGRGLAWRW